jgi:hypothetical protein
MASAYPCLKFLVANRHSLFFCGQAKKNFQKNRLGVLDCQLEMNLVYCEENGVYVGWGLN